MIQLVCFWPLLKDGTVDMETLNNVLALVTIVGVFFCLLCCKRIVDWYKNV